MKYAEFANKILLEAIMPGLFNTLRGFGRATMYGVGRGMGALGQGAGLGGAMKTGLTAGRNYGRTAVGNPLRRAGLTRRMMGAAKQKPALGMGASPLADGTGGADKFATGAGLGVAGVGILGNRNKQRQM